MYKFTTLSVKTPNIYCTAAPTTVVLDADVTGAAR
jgi:hypothetical protein